ncbi:Tat pathway signal protein [Lacticaseibacillus yichunensis]|uniref:Tat pathway signal protein n=1 Tax=Lacticaseibacillus yichunensis TaxID=2486015 RepID=A0ABW4CRD1_9LACO|nr:Tat pathway signal protein [Lacticaseibacillus yichunensis]
MKETGFFSRRSVIVGTTTLIGLVVGLLTKHLLLGVAIGLAVGYILEAWTPLFKQK